MSVIRTWWSSFRRAYETRRSVRWLVELSLVAALVVAISMWQARHHVRGALPALRLRTLDGKSTSLAEVAGGKPTLLYVWAPWCGVCKVESQNIGWVRSWAGATGNVISVATAYERASDVQGYVKERSPGYPVYLGDSAFQAALAVESFPTMYFLDGAGRVKRSVSGYTTTAGLLFRLWLP